MKTDLPETLNIIPQASLSSFTTFQLGGPCKGLINCQTPDELKQAIKFLHDNNKKFILIGGGSNLVVSDQGVDCYVIRFVSENPIIKKDNDGIVVSASTILDDFVQWALENELKGINYCSGIPGTVGGAVVGNAGAFGKQIGDVLKYIEVLNPDGSSIKLNQNELGFKYRHSNLKESHKIVSSVCLSLQKGNKDFLQKERDEILATRKSKHPDLKTHPCAGSFFRNIEPTSKADKRQAAGYFLEQAGGKELKIGGAYIFPKHANIIVKGDQCTAQHVHDLSCQMAQAVKDKFDLNLVREVRFVGPIDGKPKTAQKVIW